MFWRGVFGGGLVPEGEGVDGMGGVEFFEGHLRRANTEGEQEQKNIQKHEQQNKNEKKKHKKLGIPQKKKKTLFEFGI